MQLRAEPYKFPIGGNFDPARTAILVIDMQRDFCDPEGYLHSRGDDVTHLRSIVSIIKNVLQRSRACGIKVIYTREGHRPDLSDLPTGKRLKTALAGAEIGSEGPLGRLLVRGEHGWDIVSELEPQDDEVVIDKPGTGAFHGTDLHHVLSTQGIENVILTGVTTGVCVTSTAREASDRGYNVLVLSDCCAEPDLDNHNMAIKLLMIEGGYLAAVTESHSLIEQMAGVLLTQ